MTYTTVPFAPVPPIAVYPAYIRDEEVTLDAAQLPRSLSGSDFIIKSAAGEEMFKCTGAAFLNGDRKVITDMAGKELYKIANKTVLLSKTFTAENEAGETVLKVEQSGMRANFEVTFTNAITKKEVLVRLRGNIWASEAEVTLVTDTENESEQASVNPELTQEASAEEPIAKIRRHIWSKEDIFLNRRRHTITIAPGVDISLMVAICMCFDECKNEPRPHSLGL